MSDLMDQLGAGLFGFVILIAIAGPLSECSLPRATATYDCGDFTVVVRDRPVRYVPSLGFMTLHANGQRHAFGRNNDPVARVIRADGPTAEATACETMRSALTGGGNP